MAKIGAFICLAVSLAGCMQSPPSGQCDVTPTTTHVANGHILYGKRTGGAFFYLSSTDRERVFRANQPAKLLVFLDAPPDPPPGQLLVRGYNRATQRTLTFENSRHSSEYGTEWGTNYIFPEPGCWRLSVADPPRGGEIVIFVGE